MNNYILLIGVCDTTNVAVRPSCPIPAFRLCELGKIERGKIRVRWSPGQVIFKIKSRGLNSDHDNLPY
jgi:hypothetical protein